MSDGSKENEIAHIAAEAVLSNLMNRRGIRQAFAEVDDDVMDDIQTDMANEIENVYNEEIET